MESQVCVSIFYFSQLQSILFFFGLRYAHPQSLLCLWKQTRFILNKKGSCNIFGEMSKSMKPIGRKNVIEFWHISTGYYCFEIIKEQRLSLQWESLIQQESHAELQRLNRLLPQNIDLTVNPHLSAQTSRGFQNQHLQTQMSGFHSAFSPALQAMEGNPCGTEETGWSWKEWSFISGSPNLASLCREFCSPGNSPWLCGQGQILSATSAPLGEHAEGASSASVDKNQASVSPSERQILHYKGQSVGETR